MVNIKMLTAAAALASLGIAAPAIAEDTTPDTTIHEESPRAGTGVSVGADPKAVKHNRGEADDATGDDRMNPQDDAEVDASETGEDAAVHSSAYKKTYPDEPEVSELGE
ncbi:hypothetical protein [Halopseudomonas sp.]|uniref:hypothetical protein n=1 Tax=Halopseudomonas sp. TaxID=2901191 RepID=UPI00356B32BB